MNSDLKRQRNTEVAPNTAAILSGFFLAFVTFVGEINTIVNVFSVL